VCASLARVDTECQRAEQGRLIGWVQLAMGAFSPTAEVVQECHCRTLWEGRLLGGVSSMLLLLLLLP
jgi:hypothetical protein